MAPRTLIQLLHLAPLPLRGRAPLVGTTLETPERAALSPSAAPRRRRGPERDRAPNKKAVPPEPPQTKPVCVCLCVCASVRTRQGFAGKKKKPSVRTARFLSLDRLIALGREGAGGWLQGVPAETSGSEGPEAAGPVPPLRTPNKPHPQWFA